MSHEPIYMTAGALSEIPSSHSEGSVNFHHSVGYNSQNSTYYSPAPTTYSTSFISHDRKSEYLLVPGPSLASDDHSSSSHHNLTPVRLPSLSGVTTLSLTKEHPAALQADQMNAYMDSYFVEHEPSTSAESPNDEHAMHMESHQRYSRIPDEEKLEQRRLEEERKRQQREEERKQLEELLRNSQELDEDPEVIERLREQRSKMKRAEAARSRYQRMSENERRVYNQRRRLRALGLDPDGPKTQMEQDTIKEHIRAANAKKAEAARLRYHRMTPEEKRDYNQRRTESFRKRRMEEEMLLSTPAGRISADALQKAQQIMIRNAKKAQAARERYQKMTPEERKVYNMRRAQAKRMRNANRSMTPGMMSSDCSIVSAGDLSDGGLGTSFQSEPSSSLLDDPDPSRMMSSPGIDVDVEGDIDVVEHSMPAEDVFQEMEKQILKRTRQAHLAIARQQGGVHDHSRYQDHSMHEQQAMSNESTMLANDNQLIANNSMQQHNEKLYLQQSQFIEEKALHEMLITGRDANGQPVELRTVDGTPIRREEELRAITNGQPILIHPQPVAITMSVEDKGNIYCNADDEISHLDPSTSMQSNMYEPSDEQIRYRTAPAEARSQSQQILAELSSVDPSTLTSQQRQEISKAKRAARARDRYHSMRPELRQQQNAKRAEALRKSRQRDEQLCQMVESGEADQVDEDTKRMIREAQDRRRKRAEQARAKYHRMNSEERRQYNAMRDAQRRQRKREQETRAREHMKMDGHHIDSSADRSMSGDANGTDSLSPAQSEPPQQILYSTYEMYQEPTQWDQ